MTQQKEERGNQRKNTWTHTHTHIRERRHLLPVTDCTIAGWIKYRIETLTNQENVMNDTIVTIIL